jgi:hypothetical protein
MFLYISKCKILFLEIGAGMAPTRIKILESQDTVA